MARGSKPTPLAVTPDEHGQLTAWTARPKTAQALALRARIVLAAAGGGSNSAIARHLRVTLPTVRKWRERFARRRLGGLVDEPRPGAPRSLTDEQIERAVMSKDTDRGPMQINNSN